MEFNIHYRSCIISLIFLLFTRVDLSFTVYKLEMFSSNPGKVNFEWLLNLLIYIRDNTNLVLKYSAGIRYETLSDLLGKSNIKTENQLVAFSGSCWQDCTDTDRIIGAYIIFYQVFPIDHGTHVPIPVAQ